MTDEELGRAWARNRGKRPAPCEKGHVHWSIDGHRTDPAESQVPMFVYDALDCERFLTESIAYAALGAALRQLVAFADGVREVMGE